MSYEALERSGRKSSLFKPSATTRELALRRRELELLLPHRDPFLMLDALVAVDLEERCIAGRRRIDPADPVLAGHFPGEPVYPGVLQLETMAQVCICLQHFVANKSTEPPATATPLRLRLLRVHHAIFSAEVRPGDQLTVVGKILEDNGYTSVLAGQILRGETICAFCVLEAYLLDGDASDSV
jgi:3-hydroxymyristoyl/3-hydroxydecanoyl-(acyl carrier protein) dehydratase